ncbi:RNA polymerase sigma factor [Spongiivirga citrea]|uniref:Sigma-70 family RNA polymerase sigma factor n=1 Tax=Spongiivirga citrea TaxID=1481457 RepID=A0A6M0CKB1_9FLAO|nr:sigma-70 family RNA polymerase sigma factor [Spongiivirga citrea]NER18386.1 sigma-70 family RNA polymerase sigma factor [Spongiivirga citrea]
MSTFLEAHIVQLLGEEDERAVGLIYDNYADTLYGVAYKITKDDALAQDALQESFVKIWKKAASYDAKKAKLFTWLFRITRNTAIDKLRSANLRDDREIQIDISDVYNLGTTSLKPEHLDVKDHIGNLDEKYQEVLNALFFEGMTHQEASEALDVPLGTVKSRLKIGLRELRKVFNCFVLLIILVL